MKKPLELTIHILSPVHIGCDDVYEPTRFIIDESRNKLIEFDPFDFITSLTPKEREEFENTCMQGKLLDIYKFIRRAYKPKIGGRMIDICSDLVDHYKKVLALSSYDSRMIINQFTLNRTAYGSDSLPYLPGSSLKGSLRTAWLNHLNQVMGVRHQPRQRGSELEKSLLKGSFDKDPFRMVKTADSFSSQSRSRIIYGLNRKKKQGRFEARGPLQIFEAIKEGTVFQSILDVQQPPRGSGIERPVTSKDLMRSLHAFYMPIMEEENRIYTSISAHHTAFRKARESFGDRLGASVFPIRLGRHSGAESVTIKGHRDIKIMQGRDHRPLFLDHSTTIWLASESSRPRSNNGLTPFGWAALEVMNPQDIT